MQYLAPQLSALLPICLLSEGVSLIENKERQLFLHLIPLLPLGSNEDFGLKGKIT